MTNFQNLSFLAELYSISSVNMEFTEKALMHIANNFEMKRLGFPKLHVSENFFIYNKVGAQQKY